MFLYLRTLAATLLLISIGAAQAETPTSPDELIGVWKAERHFGPSVRGPLYIERDGESWRASIAGFSAVAQVADDEIAFTIDGDLGNFRGRLTEDESHIAGHWIQPQTVMMGNAFASPVELVRSSPDLWTGDVVPLDDQMTLFLVVSKNDDGTVGAFLRNPERNLGIFLRIPKLEREGDIVRFLGNTRLSESKEPVALFEGTSLPDSGTLALDIEFAGGSFDFVRVDDDPVSGFLPRGPGGAYQLRAPTSLEDGWTTTSLEDVGMSPEPLAELLTKIEKTPIDSVLSPYLHAILVARHGKLVFEEYFHGFHRDRPHDTRSASKSLTSTLIGVAINDGAGFEVDTPVYKLLNDGVMPSALDPRKERLTVEHLLTMTSGFDCDDNDYDSPGNEDVMQSQTEQPDWIRYTLDLPMKREPGALSVYCSAGSNLLGEVLRKATGRSLPEYFHTGFAEPMQMGRYHMNLSPTGDAYMGGGIYWMPRDFLKLGQLLLDDGEWNGKRLLSEDYVARATSPIEDLNKQKYGYAWWIIPYEFGGRTVQAFYAGGNGGQMVIVIPELDLSILFMAGNYSHFRSLLKFRDEYVQNYILRAVETD